MHVYFCLFACCIRTNVYQCISHSEPFCGSLRLHYIETLALTGLMIRKSNKIVYSRKVVSHVSERRTRLIQDFSWSQTTNESEAALNRSRQTAKAQWLLDFLTFLCKFQFVFAEQDLNTLYSSMPFLFDPLCYAIKSYFKCVVQPLNIVCVVQEWLNKPVNLQTASIFYKTLLRNKGAVCDGLRLTWQKDLNIEISEEGWSNIIPNLGWATRDARSKFIHSKTIYRYYFTPSKLFKMGLIQSDACWKCGTNAG